MRTRGLRISYVNSNCYTSIQRGENDKLALGGCFAVARDGDLSGSRGSLYPAVLEGALPEGSSEGAGEVRPSFAPVEALSRKCAVLRADGVEVDSELREEVFA